MLSRSLLSHFEYISVWYEVLLQRRLLTCGCPASPVLLVEGTVFSVVLVDTRGDGLGSEGKSGSCGVDGDI